jgi:ribonuclease Z
MFERRALLFELGHIAALAPRKLSRVGHAFISHAHIDHFAGFDRPLRLFPSRDKTVALYGPIDFIDRVQHKLQAYTWNVIRNYTANLVFQVTEVYGDRTLRSARFQSSGAFQREDMPETTMDGDLLISSDALRVRCAMLDHATPPPTMAGWLTRPVTLPPVRRLPMGRTCIPDFGRRTRCPRA